VVLSTLSVAAIAGPLAFQALEVQKNEVRVGTGNPNGPTVGGISSIAVTEPPSTSTSSTTESVDLVPEDETSQQSAPAPITSAVPVSTSAPTIAPSKTEATLGQSNSVERTEAPDETQELPADSAVSEVQIPSSLWIPPTWIVDPGNTLTSLPSTTIPGGDSSSTPSTTEASTSGSVTTAGPPISEPLEPIDTTTTTGPDTTLPDQESTTTEPIDTVITEPLEPVDTTAPSSTTTSDPGTSSTNSTSATTTVESSVPLLTSTTGDPHGDTTTTQG
jgi:hypothetical protein